MIEIVHCLVCSKEYEEHETFIKVCPHCSNEDCNQTHYIVLNKEERGEDENH